ncbi:MAG: DUF2474 domain-containing protein [Pseudomonadota bacterium]
MILITKVKQSWQLLAWFIGLWLLGVVSVGILAYLIRWMIL